MSQTIPPLRVVEERLDILCGLYERLNRELTALRAEVARLTAHTEETAE